MVVDQVDVDLVFENCAQELSGVDFFSVRFCQRESQDLGARQGVMEPGSRGFDQGFMISVHDKGGAGYGASCDLSAEGIRAAARIAKQWADRTRELSIPGFADVKMPSETGEYASAVSKPWQSVPLSDQLDLIRQIGDDFKKHDFLVDHSVALSELLERHWYRTNQGGATYQEFSFVFPNASVTAHTNGETQSRSFAGGAFCRQGGFELIEQGAFLQNCLKLADEANQLCHAPNCPDDVRSVLIDPDQMILQIHESIGHPLELDRILGDERNYAGTSFVTKDMFGTYQYGSDLLNVVFDPHEPGQIASYGYDDDGLKAKPEHVIKGGLLVRPLGGVLSQQRAGMPGVANVRANGWNRPPIDRMANLNVVPGESTFDEMVAATEKGIYLKTNNSWSIDDSRNKFQFGCEWGQLIENGELTSVVKKPNYRGVSADFWRGLKMVGNEQTRAVYGTPYCGKGEPNQVIRVGHASPACLFEQVAVFGGV